MLRSILYFVSSRPPPSESRFLYGVWRAFSQTLRGSLGTYCRSGENFLELQAFGASRGSTARSNKQPSRLRPELARNSSSRRGGALASALAPRCLSNVFRGGVVTARVARFLSSRPPGRDQGARLLSRLFDDERASVACGRVELPSPRCDAGSEQRFFRSLILAIPPCQASMRFDRCLWTLGHFNPVKYFISPSQRSNSTLSGSFNLGPRTYLLQSRAN